MTDIKSFRVNVPDAEILQIRQRLELTKLPDELDQAEWDLGSPLADIKHLCNYWRNGFDWRKAEAGINKLPQYSTSIQVHGFEPLKIHFVHQVSLVAGAIPLLFCHGCMQSTFYLLSSLIEFFRAWKLH